MNYRPSGDDASLPCTHYRGKNMNKQFTNHYTSVEKSDPEVWQTIHREVAVSYTHLTLPTILLV